ncbi:sigma-70 family RNA polymerase sigma factor [Thalassobacillus hwangdonensis]|uniref:Sigma-70 family RNA polymerase sigma factor n=1 Tax=Thalassobacillus hwangdonensis TaxID=546108 RepID=A0ABW3L421_9BACI
MTLPFNPATYEAKLDQCKRIIYKLARNFPHLEDDELYQEGKIVLYECMQTYEETRSAFSTYFYNKITFRFLDLHRQHIRHAKIGYLCTSTTDTYVPINSLDTIFNEDLHHLLTPNQLKWFDGHVIEGRTYKEIAARENTSIDAVKGWGRAAKSKLRTYLSIDN